MSEHAIMSVFTQVFGLFATPISIIVGVILAVGGLRWVLSIFIKN
jgi:hypothetical protein